MDEMNNQIENMANRAERTFIETLIQWQWLADKVGCRILTEEVETLEKGNSNTEEITNENEKNQKDCQEKHGMEKSVETPQEITLNSAVGLKYFCAMRETVSFCKKIICKEIEELLYKIRMLPNSEKEQSKRQTSSETPHMNRQFSIFENTMFNRKKQARDLSNYQYGKYLEDLVHADQNVLMELFFRMQRCLEALTVNHQMILKLTSSLHRVETKSLMTWTDDLLNLTTVILSCTHDLMHLCHEANSELDELLKGRNYISGTKNGKKSGNEIFDRQVNQNVTDQKEQQYRSLQYSDGKRDTLDKKNKRRMNHGASSFYDIHHLGYLFASTFSVIHQLGEQFAHIMAKSGYEYTNAVSSSTYDTSQEEQSFKSNSSCETPYLEGGRDIVSSASNAETYGNAYFLLPTESCASDCTNTLQHKHSYSQKTTPSSLGKYIQNCSELKQTELIRTEDILQQDSFDSCDNVISQCDRIEIFVNDLHDRSENLSIEIEHHRKIQSSHELSIESEEKENRSSLCDCLDIEEDGLTPMMSPFSTDRFPPTCWSHLKKETTELKHDWQSLISQLESEKMQVEGTSFKDVTEDLIENCQFGLSLFERKIEKLTKTNEEMNHQKLENNQEISPFDLAMAQSTLENHKNIFLKTLVLVTLCWLPSKPKVDGDDGHTFKTGLEYLCAAVYSAVEHAQLGCNWGEEDEGDRGEHHNNCFYHSMAMAKVHNIAAVVYSLDK